MEPEPTLFDVGNSTSNISVSGIDVDMSSDKQLRADVKTMGSILGTLLALFIYFQFYPSLNHQHCHLPLTSQATFTAKDASSLSLLDEEASFS